MTISCLNQNISKYEHNVFLYIYKEIVGLGVVEGNGG